MWRTRARAGLGFLTALLAFAGCAGELSGDPNAYRVERGSGQGEPGCDVTPIFAAHCSGDDICHSGTHPQNGLDLVSPGVGKRLLGAKSASAGCTARFIVDPKNYADSFLLEKIGGSKPECGDSMPLTGSITDADRACIRDWAAALTGVFLDSGAPGADAAPPKRDASAPADAGKRTSPDGGAP